MFINNLLLKWLRAKWAHLLAWSLFIVYETVVVGLVFGMFGNIFTYILHYVIIISMFYVLANKAWPWAIKDNRWVFYRTPLMLSLIITTFILANYFVDLFLVRCNIIKTTTFGLKFDYILKVLYRCIYFLGFATAYYFINNYINEKRKTLELEKMNLQSAFKEERMAKQLSSAQNSFLKAQITPHFLFNTLDYIYHNIEPFHKEASDAIISLSQILRYAVDSTSQTDFIRISDEIEQAQRLINIYQLRKKNTLNINLSVSKSIDDLYIIPLVVLTLVENIFKHGSLSHPDHPALISIYLQNDQLFITTDNLIEGNKNNIGTNAGLANIESRILYSYGKLASFSYCHDIRNHFLVFIAIPTQGMKS